MRIPGHDAATRRGREFGRLGALLLLLVLLLTSGCTSDPAPAGPHELATDQAGRLAIARFNLYQAGTVSVDAQIVSTTSPLQLSGWLDTANHRGYGLVSAASVQPFLTFWTTSQVSAQASGVARPPLPVPKAGWDTMPLSKDTSILAAAQLLMVGLASDRPENPQLLLQSGATWLRQDTVSGTAVDVVSGPVAEGATESSYRYWVDSGGNLLRVEARLDGRNWSRFTLTRATDVTLDPPA